MYESCNYDLFKNKSRIIFFDKFKLNIETIILSGISGKEKKKKVISKNFYSIVSLISSNFLLPSSQFKNKFVFKIIGIELREIFLNINIMRNYLATNHGKGAVDGVSGTIE